VRSNQGGEAGVSGNGNFCLVTSALSGHLYRWEGRKKCTNVLAVGPSPIHAMAAVGYSEKTSRLVIGNNDGCVKVYGASLEIIVEYNLADLDDSTEPRCIRSVDMFGYSYSNEHLEKLLESEGGCKHGSKLLVGTLGSDIFEIEGPDPDATGTRSIKNLHEGALVKGHFRNDQTKKHEVWGLAMDPHTNDLFATTGDDSTVRIWSMESRKILSCFTLEDPDGTKESARAIAWSKRFNKDGSSFLAVGLGGDTDGIKKGSTVGGVVLLLVPPVGSNGTGMHLAPVHRVSSTDSGVAIGCVTDIKVFVDDDPKPRVTIAVASQNGSIYIGEVDTEKQHLKFPTGRIIESDQRRSSGNADFASHIDFSSCGSYLQSNWVSSDLRFHLVKQNLGNGKKEKVSAKTLCDETWDSWTCPLGWPVRGIWPAGADGSEISAVHRSRGREYVAVADDMGKVKVFNYPCTVEGSEFVSRSGHSSRVTNVRFSMDDTHLVTCGGSDRSVMLWKVDVTFDE